MIEWGQFMGLKRRKFTKDFKLQVLREIDAGKPVAVASREHQIHPNLIGKWRKESSSYADRAFAGNGNSYKDQARTAELERMIGRLTMENDFLKKALSHMEAHRQVIGRRNN